MSKKNGNNTPPQKPRVRVLGRTPDGNFIEDYREYDGYDRGFYGDPDPRYPPRSGSRREPPSSDPPRRSSESVRQDASIDALFMLAGAMGGASTDELADAIDRRGHGLVGANNQLPINGSPGYRERMKQMTLVVLEGAEERLAILKGWLENPELPLDDKGRVEYQIGALSEDIERARVWKALGVEFGDPVDQLFREVKLPVGWSRKSTDHAMYSDFVDAQGRKRISMFYKAAFWDTDAFMRVIPRFTVDRKYEGDENYIRYRVLDGDKVIYEAAPRHLPRPSQRDANEKHRVYYQQLEEIEKELRVECCTWLGERYPNYRDPAAHWDDP